MSNEYCDEHCNVAVKVGQLETEANGRERRLTTVERSTEALIADKNKVIGAHAIFSMLVSVISPLVILWLTGGLKH